MDQNPQQCEEPVRCPDRHRRFMRKKNHGRLSAILLSMSLMTGIPTLSLQAEETVPEAPEAYGPIPSAGQMKYYKEEMSGFVHFGMNTFTNAEWGNGKEDPNLFQPTDLNTDQWAETFKNAGFGRVILTAKHHDGFNLYPTSISNHSVASSSWRNGEGDVVQDFVNSIKKYNMGLGFYLSPWDQNLPSYSKDVDPDYNDTYIHQMEELFDYAEKAGIKVDEFWMDGACGDVSTRPKYDLRRWWDKLEELNPDIVYQQNYGANLRWIGNESGEGSDVCWQTIDYDYVWNLYDQHGQEDASYLHTGEPYIEGDEDSADMWSIPETDVSIRSGWFYHSNQSPKSPEQLAELYFSSVGLGSPLLLNIPPNPEGQIDQQDVDAVMGMRSILDETFDDDLTELGTATASSIRGDYAESYGPELTVDDDYDTYWAMDDEARTGTVTVEFDSPQYMDVIEIQEYIPLGQRISSFKTQVLVNGQWQDYGSGHTIGYKRLIKGAPVMAEGVRVVITDSYATPLINNIGVYKADDRIAEAGRTAPGKIEAEDFDSKQGGPYAQVNDGVGNVGSLRNGDWMCFDNVSFLQSPAKFAMTYGAISAGIPIELRLDAPDGELIASLETEKTGDYTAWTTTTVDCEPGLNITGTHKVYLCVNAGLNIDSFELIGKNSIGFAGKEIRVYEGEPAEITITRSDEDLSEEVTVTVETAPGTAVHGRHYEDASQVLTFAPGETEKTFTVNTIDNEEVSGDLSFSVVLKNASSNAALNPSAKFTVTIVDNDSLDTSALESLISTAESRNEAKYKPSTWKVLKAALEEAKALLDGGSATQKEIDAAAASLQAALDQLKDLCYDQDDPAVLSETESVKLQAEDMVLNGTAEKYLRNGADGYEVINVGSQGSAVQGDVHAYVNVPAAGTYTVEMRYFTGAQNYMKWIVDEAAENGGEKKLNWTGTASYHTDTMEVFFPTAGIRKIRFYHDEQGTCNPDSFTFTLKEKLPDPVDPSTVNKTLLSQAVSEADRLEAAGALEGVNELVVNEFHAALVEAKALLEDASADQESVNASWRRLSHAIQMLEFTTDKTALEELIDRAESIKNSLNEYEIEGQDEFLAVLDYAKQVAEDPTALDDVSIAQAISRLQASMDALVRRPVELNFVILDFLMEQAKGAKEEDFMSDSYAALQTALASAKTARETAENQQQIDAEISILHQAYLNLRRKASEELLKELNRFSQFVLSLPRALFTSAELSELDALHSQVTDYLDLDEIPEQEGTALLNLARDLREKAQKRIDAEKQDPANPEQSKPEKPEQNKPEKPEENVQPETPKNEPSEKKEPAETRTPAKSVKTAASSHLSAAAVLMAASLAALEALRRNRKSK